MFVMKFLIANMNKNYISEISRLESLFKVLKNAEEDDISVIYNTLGDIVYNNNSYQNATNKL